MSAGGVLMLLDKIWKHKDGADDSDNHFSKRSYVIYTGINNSPNYSYAEGDCISCNGWYVEGYATSEKGVTPSKED